MAGMVSGGGRRGTTEVAESASESTVRALPAPEPRLALPAPEKRLALPKPATDKHHVFAQQKKLRDQFEAAGIKIHADTVRIPRSLHKQIHPRWNQEWDRFFQQYAPPSNRTPTIQEITEQAAKMNREFGLDDHISGVVRYRSGKPSKGWVKID